MLYETRMLEREQAAGKIAYAEGIEQGKVDFAKIILENQMENGSTLEQATEFVKNFKLISDRELEKIVAMYK